VTAGAPSIPETLESQLADGGRLVIPVGSAVSQILMRVTREGDHFRREEMVGCVFVKLVGRFGWEVSGPG
jgi:protein-L-isoaspartate(D-aspartate) O-methyltransferase